MNGQKNWATYLLIGIIAISMPLTVSAQEVMIEIAGNKAVVSLPPISEGSLVLVPISTEGDFTIKAIALGAAGQIDQLELTIEILDEKPMGYEEVNGTVYQYFTIITANLEPENLANAKIEFRIPKTWLNANNVESTTVGLLGIFEGEWSIQPTQETDEASDEVIFTADLPNLSFINYAISGNIPMVTTTTTETTIKTTTTYIATITTTSTPVFTSTVTSVVQGSNTIAYIAIGAAAVAVIILLAISRSSRKGPPQE